MSKLGSKRKDIRLTELSFAHVVGGQNKGEKNSVLLFQMLVSFPLVIGICLIILNSWYVEIYF